MKNFSNSTVIYTKPSCPHCIEAKRVLAANGYTFTEVVVDGVNNTKQSMMSDLGQTDLNTVPQIVLQGTFIPGGCSGLKQHLGVR